MLALSFNYIIFKYSCNIFTSNFDDYDSAIALIDLLFGNVIRNTASVYNGSQSKRVVTRRGQDGSQG